MARRKVTMLEAFEASAREARQRERSEQRRNAAERRGVVGSLLSPFRSGEELVDAGERAPDGVAGPEKPSLGVGAVPIDRRPPGGSSWEGPLITPEHDGPDEADADPPSEPEVASVEAAADVVEAPAPGRAPASDEPGEFALPMSGWSFVALVALALAAVFAVGLRLGGTLGGAPRDAERASGDARVAGFSGDLEARPAAAPAVLGPSASPVGTGGAAPTEPAAAREPGHVAEEELTPAQRSFLDPKSRVTVIAVTYDDSPENRKLALRASETLAGEGLPALPPWEYEDRIFVFVGAAETVSDLEDELHAVRAVRNRRTGAAEFRSAYVVNIADYEEDRP